MKTLSQSIARFSHQLKVDVIPPEILEKARTCLFYNAGVALGSNMTPYAATARRAAIAMHGVTADGATLLGDGRKSAILGALVANSAMFHGRTQDDTCGAAHLGAMIIPTLIALIETRRYPVARLLPALVAGYEVGGGLEIAGASGSTQAGFRASPVFGSIAVAAACAKIMDLTESQIAAAIANAASFAGGTLQAFDDGTEEWRYQLGVAALNGLLSAELAAAGSLSSSRALEGGSGFFRAFARLDIDAGAIIGRLGQEWSLQRVTFKPFPVCAFNQTPVTAALRLRKTLGSRRVERAEVRMNPYETGYAGIDSKGPFSTISGTLMSIPFCIAQSILRGAPTMTSMTSYNDVEVNTLARSIALIGDPALPRLSCSITLDLEDGTSLSEKMVCSTQDYNFPTVIAEKLVRDIGEEMRIPAAAYNLVVNFARNLPSGSIDDVLNAFAMISPAR